MKQTMKTMLARAVLAMVAAVTVTIIPSGCIGPGDFRHPPMIELPTYTASGNPGAQQMKRGIFTGAARKGWIVTEPVQGKIRCKLVVRAHTVDVDVLYTDNSFTIRYADSTNLHYDPETKTIHRRYTTWVQGLYNAIIQQVEMAK
ncbi:MAG: hypothetical protein IJR99_09765 [Kiritimatiellae bacterium]|nr:hypothetical protein [Kiritimatiellia bacterium]